MKIPVNESLASISPYIPGKPIDEVKREYGLTHVIKLASNENPYGCSPQAKEAVLKALDHAGLYPDSHAYSLRQSLSKKHGLTPEQFFFGAGSDGIIEMIPHAFLNHGDEAIMPTPSFPLYKTNTLIAGGTPVEVPLDANFSHDFAKILQSITKKTKIIWLCNPNNPTGTLFSHTELANFLPKVPSSILIVLDEAYYEYMEGEDKPHGISLLPRYSNLLILRTFSKAFGLASARIGYAMAQSEIISALEKVRSPFNVSALAQEAALHSLEDEVFLQESILKNRKAREIYLEEFNKMGLRVLPSHTNFVLVDTGKDSHKLFEALLKKGVIVRGGYCFGLNTWLRISIGTEEECRQCINALKECMQNLN